MRNWNRKTSSSKLSSVSISFSTAAKGNFNHNRRTNSKVPENVDPTRTAFNKILIDKDIRQVYKEVFGEALAEYNANQVAKKHPERQKKDYYSSICHDKKTEPFREAVVQIGNKDKQISRWESNEILQKFLKKFQENNPQLVVVGAYIHNDETTPHMHIVYVPVATYSKGLKTRVSNDKALNQMGYKTWNDWKDSQMACLENLVREKGYDREYMHNTNKHEPDVQKFIQSETKLIAEANKRIQNIETIPNTLPTRTAKTTSGELVHIFSQQEYKSLENMLIKHNLENESLKAQKNVLELENKKMTSEVHRLKQLPYTAENENLKKELSKKQELLKNTEQLSAENQQLKNQINTLNNLQVENNNLKLDLEKEKQRSKNFKIIGKLYQCMYLYLMNNILPSVLLKFKIEKFKIVELINDQLNSLFANNLNDYQKKSANPDIYTQLFQDNTALNNSYPNIDQEFANLPDVDELIEQSELDQENDYEHYQ